LRRLLRLVDVATGRGRRDEVLTLEAGRTVEGPLAQRSGLVASLLLLAGRVDEASGLLAAADRSSGNTAHIPVRWSCRSC